MNIFFKIKTVARYESKTLLRSWFFRIFSAIALIFIVFFNLFAFGILGPNGMPGRLIPGTLPYLNMFFLNIAQAIIAVFLSADFLGRDKKLDTTEAFYIRDISNFAYVAGKTFGILKVFFILNIIVLVIGAVVTLISNDLSFNLYAFILYPLLISVPTLIFVLGLSFFVMLLVRNQAVTFVLLLGYIAVALFYLNFKLYGTWDFISFFMPLAYSDFSGFFEFDSILLLRGAYLIAGLFFISVTIAMLPRLPQGKQFKLWVYTISLVLLIVSSSLFGVYLNKHMVQEARLNKVRELNKSLVESNYSIQAYDIDLKHNGNKISCTTILTIDKDNDAGTGDLVLALNPGLKITSLKVNGKQVDFKRDMHLVAVSSTVLGNEQPLEVELDYSGKVDNSVLFPDVSDDAHRALNRQGPGVYGKMYSLVAPNYVLLTREANWYPFVASKQYWTKYRFSDFRLKVKTKEGLTAISQGRDEEPAPGEFSFTPETKLNAMSLTIGNYVVKKTVIDSVEMRIYQHPDHTVYLTAFDSIQDTISYLIKDVKGDYERKLGVKYPFKRLSVVESPIHFFSYLRTFSLATENIMPEIIFFPEVGGGDWRNDLSIQSRNIDRMTSRSNEELSGEEKQVRLFKRFIGNNFIQPTSFFRGIRITGGREIEGWGKYMVFPMFYAYRDYIDQNGYPVLNIAMENYLFNRQKAAARGSFSGLNANDRVILSLKDKSLKELIGEKDESEYANIIAAKGTQLLSTLCVNWESIDFDAFIDTLLLTNAFNDYSINGFVDNLSNKSGEDFSKVLDEWMNETKVAAFIYGSVDVFKIKDGERVRHFIRLPVYNSGETDGIIEFVVMEGARGSRGGRFRSMSTDSDDNKITYLIKAGETVDIGFLTDQEPRGIFINTFLAKNIPSSSRLTGFNVVKKEGFSDYFEGIRPSDRIVSFSEPFEIVVDNEDEGCEIVNSSETNSIKDWWVNRQNKDNDDMEYKSLRWWNPPVKWELTAGSDFYGKYIKSAYFKRNGNGNGKIRWTAEIKESGDYDCYVYIPNIQMGRRFRQQKKKEDKYTYTVHHDDGEEEISLTLPEGGGWVLLGDFYFSEGDAIIELSDKTESALIYGDAVKWVKK